MLLNPLINHPPILDFWEIASYILATVIILCGVFIHVDAKRLKKIEAVSEYAYSLMIKNSLQTVGFGYIVLITGKYSLVLVVFALGYFLWNVVVNEANKI